MSLAVDLGYLLGGLAYGPVLLYQAWTQGKHRRDWGQRLGGPKCLPPHPRRIWIHAVSVGEMNATGRLVEQLAERLPHAEIVVSTTTDTGMARGRALFPNRYVFRYPLDFSWTVRRSLHRVMPSLIVLVELEVWYHLATLAERAGIPVAVVNGRLSQRSERRFNWIAPIARRMFTAVRLVAAQDEENGSRFLRVGVPADRLLVTGSLKWDTACVAERVAGQEEAAAALGMDAAKPTWVCGSTGPGEEQIVLRAYSSIGRRVPGCQLVIAPRKPERADEVTRLVQQSGFTCVRRSLHPDGARRVARPTDVWLIDTLGELRKLYALASVVFVGRSLAPLGGSDPMEVAALGKAMLIGPHTQNFRHVVRVLEKAGALRVVTDCEQLQTHVDRLLADPEAAARMGRAGREAVVRHQGATARTVDMLCRLLGSS